MARWGLVIDLDRCTACQACVVACKHENNVPFSTPETADAGRLMTWIQLVPVELPGRPRGVGAAADVPAVRSAAVHRRLSDERDVPQSRRASSRRSTRGASAAATAPTPVRTP